MPESTFWKYFRRVSLLVIGPFYLWLVAAWVHFASGKPWSLALLWVVIGSVIVMATFTAFGVRALEYQEKGFRFGLSTVFLITIPLGVYLSTIRWVVQGTDFYRWRLEDVIVGSLVSVAYILLTTYVLMGMAEALMWCAVGMLAWVNKRKVRQREEL